MKKNKQVIKFSDVLEEYLDLREEYARMQRVSNVNWDYENQVEKDIKKAKEHTPFLMVSIQEVLPPIRDNRHDNPVDV